MPETFDLPKNHNRAVAERNLESILDAAERLVERGIQATISAVAAEAGLSGVTVYATFQPGAAARVARPKAEGRPNRLTFWFSSQATRA